MSRAEEYRRLAHECIETAGTVSTQQARATLVQMAEVWLRLAEQQENQCLHLPPVKQQRQIDPADDEVRE
jgi:hypothetical protein